MEINSAKLLAVSKAILKTIIKIIFIAIKTFWYIFQRVFLLSFMIFLTVWLAWWLSQKPSLYRDWSEDQSKLADISFSWNTVNIKNVRNYKYNTTTNYVPWYYDKIYATDEIESLYYIIEPFSTNDWPAHTMLSFWFSGWTYISVSAEIRKEKWESFDPLLWLMNQYEIVYIIWDENDLVKLRANYRKDDVFMYPINTPKENIKELFLSVMHRADKLSKEPEFYNTLWNTCATSILNHTNNLRKEKIWWNKQILLPSHSDEIAYRLWLIDTMLPLPEARSYYKINELSLQYWNDMKYSDKIRKERK